MPVSSNLQRAQQESSGKSFNRQQARQRSKSLPDPSIMGTRKGAGLAANSPPPDRGDSPNAQAVSALNPLGRRSISEIVVKQAFSVGGVRGESVLLDLESLPLPFDIIDTCQHNFSAMDVDGSGTLSAFTLPSLFRSAFPDFTETDITTLVKWLRQEIDTQRNQAIEDGTLELPAELAEAIESGETAWADIERQLNAPGAAMNVCEAVFGEGTQRVRAPEGWRQWVWAIFDQPSSENYRLRWVRQAAWGVTLTSQITIVVSIVLMVVETSPDVINDEGRPDAVGLWEMETICIGIFTIEFLLRFIACPLIPSKDAASKGLLSSQARFWTSGFTWIDCLSIMPYYLEAASGGGGAAKSLIVLRILRLFRLMRIVRVLKLGKHSVGVQIMLLSLYRARLALVWMQLLMLMLVVMSSSLVFYVEKGTHDADTSVWHADQALWYRPNDSKLGDAGHPIQFQSIPHSMWWAVVTLITVGYGDMVPQTPLGKTIGAFTMVSGLLVLAYPVTILTNTFSAVFDEFREDQASRERRQTFERSVGISESQGTMWQEMQVSKQAEAARRLSEHHLARADGEGTDEDVDAVRNAASSQHTSPAGSGRATTPNGGGSPADDEKWDASQQAEPGDRRSRGSSPQNTNRSEGALRAKSPQQGWVADQPVPQLIRSPSAPAMGQATAAGKNSGLRAGAAAAARKPVERKTSVADRKPMERKTSTFGLAHPPVAPGGGLSGARCEAKLEQVVSKLEKIDLSISELKEVIGASMGVRFGGGRAGGGGGERQAFHQKAKWAGE